MSSPIGTPSVKESSKKSPILTDNDPVLIDNGYYNNSKPLVVESTPYTKTRTIDITTGTQGEEPLVNLETLYRYREYCPKINQAVSYMNNIILGSGLVFNSDDQEAVKVIEKFYKDSDFFARLKVVLDDSMIAGLGLFVKVYNNKTGELLRIEDFDTRTLIRIHRDQRGNPQEYVQRLVNQGLLYHNGSGTQQGAIKPEDFVELKLKPNSRRAFGQSIFQSVATPQIMTDGVIEPLMERYIKMTDAMQGAVINFGHPLTFLEYEGGQETEQKRKLAQKLQDRKPGQILLVNKSPTITVPVFDTHAKYEGFVEQINKEISAGLGFPIDILSGDFTSRASSLTTNEVFMRLIHSYQETVIRVIVEDILHPLLMRHPSGKWDTEEKREHLNISIKFKKPPLPMEVDQILKMLDSGMITVDEARNFAKEQGLDLFDDDTIKQQIIDKQAQMNMDAEVKAEEKKTALKKQQVAENFRQITSELG